MLKYIKHVVRTRFGFLAQKVDGPRLKKPNNEFVESGLKKWARMSWTTNKMDFQDKEKKIDKF